MMKKQLLTQEILQYHFHWQQHRHVNVENQDVDYADIVESMVHHVE